ncbi:MAG: LysE family translocator [Gammaproteobacteria bacterium]
MPVPTPRPSYGSSIIDSILAAIVFSLSVGFSAGLSPGPLSTLVVSFALRDGFAAGAWVALAPLVTDIPIIGLSLALVVTVSDTNTAFMVLGGAGGTYLIYLGFLTWRSRAPLTDALDNRQQALRAGVIVNFLNPHPWLFWITVGGPYLIEQQDEPTLLVIFLGGFYLALLSSKLALAGVAARTGRLLSSPLYGAIMRVLGLILVGFGVHLLTRAINLLWARI